MRDTDGEVRATVNASIAAGIGEDHDRADEQLERARAIKPDHPEVRLQDVGKMQEPAAQLPALEGLENRDEDARAA